MTMAALRSLTSDRRVLPFQRRRFTVALVVLITGEAIGLLTVAYLVSRAI